MISQTKVYIKWHEKDKVTEEVITLKDAWDRYITNQQKGGPLCMEFLTYNVLKNSFDYQYPAGFFKNEGRMQDVVVFRVDAKELGIRNKELDIPVDSVCKVLMKTHTTSLLSAQAIKSWHLGRCTVGVYHNKAVYFVPIISADSRKAEVKYKYPAKDMTDSTDVFRLAFRDNSSLVTEFLIVG